MSDLLTVFLIPFAVLGAAALLYGLIEWLFRPKESLPLFLLGKPGNAESLLRLCDHVRALRRRGWDARLLVWDEGLNEETLRVAEILARDDMGVELWNTEDLNAYVTGNAGGADPFGHF